MPPDWWEDAMTERVLGPTGSPRRRRTLLLPIVTAIALALFFVAGAQAVHDETFQLDGNVAVDAATNIGGNTQSLDWASIFTAGGANQSPLPTGFDAASFKKDFNNSGSTFLTNDGSTYATGSKDTLPIADWQCNLDNNVNSKIDVMNAYAASYTAPGGDEILYFALERNVNTGDANVGFWFLQSTVGCESTGPAADFAGGHRDGDILVVSEFSNGGSVSTINAYRWNGDDATGSLGTTPVASGADCRGSTVGTDDPICGAANTATITTPWQTAAKTSIGTSLPTAQFFEGGINLTDSQLGGKCFNTFVGDTRSSTSLTATLFDFAGGQLGQCTSTTVTAPSITTPTTIPANGTLSVTDSATVTVTGVTTFSGNVTFNLCGPAASQTLCTTGGVAVGAAKPVTTSGQIVVSDAATVTSVGHYCWRADFSGDSNAGVPPSSDARSSECFEITPRQPTLSTTAVDSSGAALSAAVTLGSTVYDTALLGNTANKPGSGGPTGSNGSINPVTPGGAAGGTITFKLYGPSPDNSPTTTECNTLASGFPAAGIAVNVSGNGTYGGASSTPAVGFAPQSPGFYFWKAEYSGDSPNTLGASHNGNCLATAEMVEVLQLQPTMVTNQRFVPNDSATVTVASGAGNLAGTVRFRLYNNATCTPAGTTLYDKTFNIVSDGTGSATSRTVSTDNATAYTTNTSFSWLVEYASTNAGHKSVTSVCNNENSSITIDNGTPSNTP